MLPKAHRETIARIDDSELAQLLEFVDMLHQDLIHFGRPVVFEHGCLSAFGGGCGLYHSHLHLVPLPEKVPIPDLFPLPAVRFSTFRAALDALRNAREYLLFADMAADTFWSLDLSNAPGAVGSQYFRRTLAQRFALNAPWDWRHYHGVEANVLNTLRYFGDQCS